MIDFPVKIKFFTDKGELKNATSGGSRNNNRGGPSGGGANSQKKTNGLLGKAVGVLGAIFSLIEFVVVLLKPIIDLMNALVSILTSLIFKQFSGLLDALFEGLSKVQEFLNGEINFAQYLDSIGQILLDVFREIPFVKQFMFYFETFVKPAFDAIAKGLRFVWTKLKEAWSVLSTVASFIWENYIKPAWEALKDVGMWIWDEILKPAWDWFAGIGEKIWTDILKPAWEWFTGIGEKIWELIKTGFTALKDKLSNFSLSSFFGGGDSGDSKAFGGVIPKDGMYRMHAGETVSRGNSVNSSSSTTMNPTININVSGGVDRRTINEISRQMRQELQTFSRL